MNEWGQNVDVQFAKDILYKRISNRSTAVVILPPGGTLSLPLKNKRIKPNFDRAGCCIIGQTPLMKWDKNSSTRSPFKEKVKQLTKIHWHLITPNHLPTWAMEVKIGSSWLPPVSVERLLAGHLHAVAGEKFHELWWP